MINRAAREARRAAQLRRCGAKRKRDGTPCAAKPLADGRCKLHGGKSTGPKTAEGRVRALANLKQNFFDMGIVTVLRELFGYTMAFGGAANVRLIGNYYYKVLKDMTRL